MALGSITAANSLKTRRPGLNIAQSQYPMGTAVRVLDTIGLVVHMGIGAQYYGIPIAKQIEMINDLGIYHVRDAPGYFPWPSGNWSAPGTDIATMNQNSVSPGGRVDRLNLEDASGTWTAFQAMVDAGLQVQISTSPLASYTPANQGGTGGGLNQSNFDGHFYYKGEVAAKRAGSRTIGGSWINNISAWEWANEWDGGPGSDSFDAGPIGAHREGKIMANYFRNHPSWYNKPVINTGRIGPPAHWITQSGTNGHLVDAGNMHPYPNGRSVNYNQLNVQIDQEKQVSGNLPKYITETGTQSNDAPATDGGSTGMTRVMVPRDVHALYALRWALYPYHTQTAQSASTARVERCFQYQLWNNSVDTTPINADGGWGWYRYDWGLTLASRRLPAAQAIKNLVTILGPRSAPSVIDPLSYTVNGFTDRVSVSGATWTNPGFPAGVVGNQDDTDALHHYAVQKADGSYLVFLFRTNWWYVWDVNTGASPLATGARYVTPASYAMTVTIPGATAISVANPRTTSTFGSSTTTHVGSMGITNASLGTGTARTTFNYNHSDVIILSVTMP